VAGRGVLRPISPAMLRFRPDYSAGSSSTTVS
jgi:hypothetical protein